MATFTLIDTPAKYDSVLDNHCFGQDVPDLLGIPRTERFERLTPDQVQQLSSWTLENAGFYCIRISNPDMALHILGAKEVDPAKEGYNLVIGKGQSKVYYFAERNQHNRIMKPTNLGTISKEGLVYDIANNLFGVGPTAHIDCWGWILSLQHRLIAWLQAYDELGEETPAINVLTLVGVPPQLAATLDRGAPKSGKDQEVIDVSRFPMALFESRCEYLPDSFDLPKTRDVLSAWLVTVRNNLYSRFQGTGYHPSKSQSPSTRQAIALQDCFETIDDWDALQQLLVDIWSQTRTEDGKKRLWVDYFPPAMVGSLIVLLSNRDRGEWQEGDSIHIDPAMVKLVLSQLLSATDTGTNLISRLMSELGKVKARPKKPSPMDRWTFYGLVRTFSLIINEEDTDGPLFPTEAEMKRVSRKKNPVKPPIFGGYDCGTRTKAGPTDDDE
jgi:hypothetical protein